MHHHLIAANSLTIRRDCLLLCHSSKHRPSTYLGKVREKAGSNRTEYAIYDSGRSSASILRDRWEERGTLTSGTLPATKRLRQELGVISYNFLSGTKFGNRRMQVAIPRVSSRVAKVEGEEGSSKSYGTGSITNDGGCTVRQWQPTQPKQSLQTSFSRIRMDGSQNVSQSDELEVSDDLLIMNDVVGDKRENPLA